MSHLPPVCTIKGYGANVGSVLVCVSPVDQSVTGVYSDAAGAVEAVL